MSLFEGPLQPSGRLLFKSVVFVRALSGVQCESPQCVFGIWLGSSLSPLCCVRGSFLWNQMLSERVWAGTQMTGPLSAFRGSLSPLGGGLT